MTAETLRHDPKLETLDAIRNRRGPPLFLASVTTVGEARLCLAGGADILDCKDPRRGALGALDADRIAAIRDAVSAPVLVSATIGDAEPLSAAIEVARLGADLVKVGIVANDLSLSTISRLGDLDLGRAHLVGVFFADHPLDLSLIEAAAHAGFLGVMLDTAGKGRGSLPDLLPQEALVRFVQEARGAGLLSGLAGSLRLGHIAALRPLQPHVLGFRGALCRNGERSAPVEQGAVAAVRAALDNERTASVHWIPERNKRAYSR